MFPVVLQHFYGLLQPIDGIPFLPVQEGIAVMKGGIHRRDVPGIREFVLGSLAVIIHPFGVIDD